ncbi:MAG: cell wall binding repeat 2-containing protein [Lachnospiraceae bacterium]|jgi:hypothetical protein|nr:cell wall binding repeat 2-containing protein [Lachnospiraceae bacterium]
MSADVNVIVDEVMTTVDDFTYTAPTDHIYDGDVKEATVIAAQGVNGLGTIEVSYKKKGEIVASPIDAGTYTVYVTTANGTNYEDVTTLEIGEFAIAKAEQSALIISYPAASGITYGQKLSTSTLMGGSTTLGGFLKKPI